MDGEGLRRLPLHDEHERLGARLVPFAGWAMPLQYTSIIDEHLQVRCRTGLFDVSHMGKLLLQGRGAVPTMQRLVASDLEGLSPGQARYTVLLTPWGGIRDDLIIYRREEGLLLVVNAATMEEDRAWIEENLLPDTELDDLSELTSLFALQGPGALPLLDRLSGMDVSATTPFTFGPVRIAGIEATVMRTGYTGEQGAELLIDNSDSLDLWRSLLAAGGDDIAPAGLGARDTLRLEAALLLYGQDVTKSTTPFAARLGWLVDLDRPEFVGQAALVEDKEKGPEILLAGLGTKSHAIPRTGDDILMGDRPVGAVTSGSLSPVLGHPIALGYLPRHLAKPGVELTVVSRSRRIPVQVMERPFYRRGVTPLPARAPCVEQPREEEGQARSADAVELASPKPAPDVERAG
jgi:aminomethyltransferase